jgi:mono/diheme cytochrome c family protein
MPRIADKDAVEPLVHYLMSLGAAKPVALQAGATGKGADLFATVGCVACHAPPAGAPKDDRAVVPLPKLDEKYRDPGALAAFLHDPLKWRPSGRMPKLNLTPAEAMSVAVKLVGLPPRAADEPAGPFEPGLAWEVYHGSWNKLPDFDALTPVSSGAGGFDLKVAK